RDPSWRGPSGDTARPVREASVGVLGHAHTPQKHCRNALDPYRTASLLAETTNAITARRRALAALTGAACAMQSSSSAHDTLTRPALTKERQTRSRWPATPLR